VGKESKAFEFLIICRMSRNATRRDVSQENCGYDIESVII